VNKQGKAFFPTKIDKNSLLFYLYSILKGLSGPLINHKRAAGPKKSHGSFFIKKYGNSIQAVASVFKSARRR